MNRRRTPDQSLEEAPAVVHPFFSAEIARQRRESLQARAALARWRRTERRDAPAERMGDDGPSSLEVEVRALVRTAQWAGIDGTLLDRPPGPMPSHSENHRSHDAA